MGKYKHDMSQEKAPEGSFPEGRNDCMIVNCEEQTSKAGNPMFMITLALLADISVTTNVYAIATIKKRWFLKNLLDVCGINAAQDGVYDWDITDILGKEIVALVKNENENWIDREGNNRTTQKGKVYGFDKIAPITGVSARPGRHEESIPF